LTAAVKKKEREEDHRTDHRKRSKGLDLADDDDDNLK
jgi:hypothetical protein